MTFKNQRELNSFLSQCGRNFVSQAAKYVQNEIKKNLNEGVYARRDSKYYTRTGQLLSAIKIGSLSETGSSRRRVGINVRFDTSVLTAGATIYKNGRMIRFGQHVNRVDRSQKSNIPNWIENGYTTFAGFGKRKKINGVHAFKKAKESLRTMMNSAGVTGWISGGSGNVKIQKTR